MHFGETQASLDHLFYLTSPHPSKHLNTWDDFLSDGPLCHLSHREMILD